MVSARWPALGGRFSQARRDAREVLALLRGRHPDPVVRLGDRPHRHARVEGGVLAGRVVRVERVARETDDAVTITIADPSGAPVAFAPGQFVTVLVKVGSETLRRAYSISSIPSDGEVTITVKRIAGGRASASLVELTRQGDTLRVLGPSGSFTVPPDAGREARYLLVAGGSGITPLFSILRALLVGEPRSHVTLLYGNRAIEGIIFRERLEALVREHAPRLVVRHVLESAPAGWQGGVGRLDRETASRELERLGLSGDEQVLSCGPTPMMSAVRDALAAQGVPRGRIREELYTTPARDSAIALPTEPQPLVVRRGSSETRLVAQPGETVLEAATRAGVTLPFSCTMGGCAACKLRLVSGSVTMPEPSCLTVDERRAGLVLTCVGHATEPTVLEVP